LRINSTNRFKLSWFMAAIITLPVLALAGCSKTDDSKVNTETNNQVIVAATRVAATGLGEALKDISGESQRVDFVRRYVNALRFMDDDSGYFFVYDSNSKNIAIAVFSELQGQDLFNKQDSHGKYFAREFVATAKKGGGFVEYYWPHPLTKVDMLKISYIAPIPGTDYLIGSGYYPGVSKK
jgi:signal transduction histidine kinase